MSFLKVVSDGAMTVIQLIFNFILALLKMKGGNRD